MKMMDIHHLSFVASIVKAEAMEATPLLTRRMKILLLLLLLLLLMWTLLELSMIVIMGMVVQELHFQELLKGRGL